MGEFKGVTWGEGKVQGGIWFIHLEYFGIFYRRLGNDVLYIEGRGAGYCFDEVALTDCNSLKTRR